MTKQRYPEDWNYHDILWSKDQFECTGCEEVFPIDDCNKDLDGNEVCSFCLSEDE